MPRLVAARGRSACAPPRGHTARPGCRHSGRRRSGCRDGCRSRPAAAWDRCRRGGRRCCPADRSRRAAGRLGPVHELVAHLLVLGRQRQPPQADVAEAADLGRAFQGLHSRWGSISRTLATTRRTPMFASAISGIGLGQRGVGTSKADAADAGRSARKAISNSPLICWALAASSREPKPRRCGGDDRRTVLLAPQQIDGQAPRRSAGAVQEIADLPVRRPKARRIWRHWSRARSASGRA